MNILEMHEKYISGVYGSEFSTNEVFLALALCGEAGELANMIKKRWRDGVDLTPEIREEIADVRVYLELIAKVFGIEGEKLDEEVEQKLKKVAMRKRETKRITSSEDLIQSVAKTIKNHTSLNFPASEQAFLDAAKAAIELVFAFVREEHSGRMK